jgi:hypothetical protein
MASQEQDAEERDVRRTSSMAHGAQQALLLPPGISEEAGRGDEEENQNQTSIT